VTTDAEKTISVPEAGKRYFGLCRGTSYIAAQRGEIPTIRIGRRVRVPVRTLEAMLDAVGKSQGKGAGHV
jgi:excisionase family DNA binding protein